MCHDQVVLCHPCTSSTGLSAACGKGTSAGRAGQVWGHPGLERRAGLGRGGRMAARLLEETLGTFVVAAGSQGRGPAPGQAAAWL